MACRIGICSLTALGLLLCTACAAPQRDLEAKTSAGTNTTWVAHAPPSPPTRHQLHPAPTPRAAGIALWHYGVATPVDATDARAIASAVNTFFEQPAEVVERDLSPDMIAILPRRADALLESSSGWLLPPWHIAVDGDEASLTYQPPQMVYTHWRSWFVLRLERKAQQWQVAHLGSAIACGLRRPSRGSEHP